MILLLSDGRQIRGDLIESAILRSDLSPIPSTLEAEIRAGDDGFEDYLQQGQTLSTVNNDQYYIIKSERASVRKAQADKIFAGYRVTAILQSCLPVAYVRSRAIIKENATLSAIYKAAGATIPGIVADFPVPRFSCLVGQTPSFHIARVLQEEGGVVRWKNRRLEFLRLQGILSGKIVRTLPQAAAQDIETGFLEHHAIPWFFSIDDSANVIFGNQAKARSVLFSPFKNAQRLHNMTRCLVRRKTAKINFDQSVCAGDIIAFGDGSKYVTITAAHSFKSGTTDGESSQAETRLWLGEVEQ